MSEEYLVWQAAPTLAGLKTGSLIPFEMKDADMETEVRRLNRSFAEKGLRLIPVKRKDRKAYGDAFEAEKMFARFRKCTAVYRKLMGGGKPLKKLAVKETRRKEAMAESA